MSNFETALKILRINEGGYNFDPNDAGGETYIGIARATYPLWAGWSIINAIKRTRKIKSEEIINDPVLDSLVTAFYQNQWNRKNLALITNTGAASLVFDTSQQHGNWGRVVYYGVNGFPPNFTWFDSKIPNGLSYDLANKINTSPTTAYIGIAESRKKYVQYLTDSGQLSKTFTVGIMSRINKFLSNAWGFVLTPGGTATAVVLAAGIFFF
ncbi:MAG: glycosyl hydrolase 108 family protein [Sediminibacterium sp.]|nr:glycosyl hydrolase 108 family protein [Sediminibacterium sp.]